MLFSVHRWQYSPSTLDGSISSHARAACPHVSSPQHGSGHASLSFASNSWVWDRGWNIWPHKLILEAVR